MRIIPVISAICVLAIACESTKNHRVLQAEQNALDSMTNNFFDEATLRGIAVASWRESLLVTFGTLTNDHAGRCQPNAHPRVVTIDHYFWKISDPATREQLLFHELAHCLLQRSHVNKTYPFGECQSWMREKDSDCQLNLRNKEWRKHYLDELFVPQRAEIPGWYDIHHVASYNEDKKTIIALTTNGTVFSSVLSCEGTLEVTQPPISFDKPCFFSITFNELIFENSSYNIDHRSVSVAMMVGDPLRRALVSVDHGKDGFRLVIQMANDCAYFFLNDKLWYCLPMEKDNMTITAFANPSDSYSITCYESALTNERSRIHQ